MEVEWEPDHHRILVSGLPDVGDLILNREEWTFLVACWIATVWRREDTQPRRAAA